MKTLFADTFYFYALINNNDEAHQLALQYSLEHTGLIITTAWVITELADGLQSPRHRPAFLRIYQSLLNNPQFDILDPSPDLFAEGIQLFSERPDKEWSLTDCISFVAMQRRCITEALTGDHHFEQAGYVALLK